MKCSDRWMNAVVKAQTHRGKDHGQYLWPAARLLRTDRPRHHTDGTVEMAYFPPVA